MDIKNLKLNTYEGLDFRANVEEELDDIELGVLYYRHGDDYFFVRTKTGKCFKYGYFANLRHENDIDRLGPEYVRKPTLLKVRRVGFDDTLHAIKYFATETTREFGWNHDKTKIYQDTKSAQWHFDNMLSHLEEYYAEGYYYNHEYYRNDIALCLHENGIATEANLKKLKDAKLTSKDADGFDGVAAKKVINYEPNALCVDGVKAVIRNGKELSKDEWFIAEDSETDEYGFSEHYFPLDQFGENVIEKCVSLIMDQIAGLHNSLSEIETGLPQADLKKLYEISNMLSNVNIYWPEDKDYEDEDEEEDYYDDEDDDEEEEY